MCPSVRGLRLNPCCTLAAILSLAPAIGVEALAGHHANRVIPAPAVLAVLVAVPGAAAWIPALGAARADPCEALRGG